MDALNVLLLLLPGTPTTYYGEEIGMKDIEVSYEDTQDPWGINLGPVRQGALIIIYSLASDFDFSMVEFRSNLIHVDLSVVFSVSPLSLRKVL